MCFLLLLTIFIVYSSLKSCISKYLTVIKRFSFNKEVIDKVRENGRQLSCVSCTCIRYNVTFDNIDMKLMGMT